MTIDTKYDFGQLVYLLTDRDQKERIVTSMEVHPRGNILYQITCCEHFSWHYDYEIVSTKDLVKALQ